MAVFSPPNTPLGKFVKANYKPALRKQVFRKLTKSGFTPPKAGGTGPKPATARDRLLPAELIGVAGVRGPFFGITPRLNPNEYRFIPNDRGRIFAEPITETTFLSPEQRKGLSGFDAETARTVPSIQTAYSDLGTSLSGEADATKDRLASLGSLIQGSAPVAGAVQGVQGADAQLADARRREAAAAAAVTVGQMSALPSIAKSEGTKVTTGYRADRQEAREGLLSGFREQNTKVLQEELDREQAAKELAAQLRGQDLSLLGTQISQQGGLERALISSQTSRQNTLDQLESRLLIAELNGQVSEANNIRTQMARIQAAGIAASTAGAKTASAAGKERKKQQASFVKDVRKSLTGAYVANPAFKDRLQTPNEPTHIPKPGTQVSPEDLLADALAQGFQALPVLNAIRATIGPGWGRGSNDAAESLLNQLTSSGRFSRAQALKIVRQFTGVKLDSQRDSSGRPRG